MLMVKRIKQTFSAKSHDGLPKLFQFWPPFLELRFRNGETVSEQLNFLAGKWLSETLAVLLEQTSTRVDEPERDENERAKDDKSE